MTKNNISINSKEIHDLIPHRYPFLLVDRIEEINSTLSCVGIKNVTINEPFAHGFVLHHMQQIMECNLYYLRHQLGVIYFSNILQPLQHFLLAHH